MAAARTHFDPVGPYDLALVAHGANDPTRRRRDDVLELAFEADGNPATARVAQRRNGRLEVAVSAADTSAALARVRYMLALDDDHTPFLKKFSRDPLIGESNPPLPGNATDAACHRLSRAAEGALRSTDHCTRGAAARGQADPPLLPAMRRAPSTADRAHVRERGLGRLGLVARKASTLVRLSRSVDLERLHRLPTREVVAWLNRERGLGPWSAGVICLEGLGRKEHGLVGDLTLMKHCTAQLGREATVADTARLLEPYGEWAGYAGLYLMASGVGGKADPEVRRLRSERNARARRAAVA